MLSRIKHWIHRATAPARSSIHGRGSANGSVHSLRRYEAAETNRLNKAHWAKAMEQPINADLVADLPTLRARTAFELSRNPILEGVANTLAQDVAGEDGPMLVVDCDDEPYAEALGLLWWEWFNKPEISNTLNGVDVLRLWVRRLLDSGEYTGQRVTKRTDPGAVGFRLKLFHPRRLYTPPEQAGDADIVMGVRRSPDGEPLVYYVAEPIRFGAYEMAINKFKAVPAREMIHEFVTIEEEQARGLPWLTTQLQTTADLRDFDHQVLDACRAAADSAVVWYTEHPDSEYLQTDATVEMERRTQSTGPPGWKPMQVKPEQPHVNHVQYRADRLREYGRPMGMPLMMIRLGSEEHSFSSARFDNEVYKRGVRSLRRFLERRSLNSFVDEVRKEGELYAAANPDSIYAPLARRLKQKFPVDFSFVWQPLIAVDAEKDAQDQSSRLQDATLDFEEACAQNGREPRKVIAAIARTIKRFKAAGIPLPAWAQTWGDPAYKQQLQQKQNEQADRPPRRSGRRDAAPSKGRKAHAYKAQKARTKGAGHTGR